LYSPDGTAVQAKKVREFSPGSRAEGCGVDDLNGTLFVSEEDVGIWAYGAESQDGDRRAGVDTVANGHLTADSEGISLVDEGNGAGYLIASSQGSNSYNVYDRAAPYAFKGAFVITDGAIDGAEETDGLDVTAASLGPSFPAGLFVAQDGFNVDGKNTKKANQNFKLLPWPAIRGALKLPALAQ
jgi:3-phytase